jgi:hypothetical protein
MRDHYRRYDQVIPELPVANEPDIKILFYDNLTPGLIKSGIKIPQLNPITPTRER